MLPRPCQKGCVVRGAWCVVRGADLKSATLNTEAQTRQTRKRKPDKHGSTNKGPLFFSRTTFAKKQITYTVYLLQWIVTICEF